MRKKEEEKYRGWRIEIRGSNNAEVGGRRKRINTKAGE